MGRNRKKQPYRPFKNVMPLLRTMRYLSVSQIAARITAKTKHFYYRSWLHPLLEEHPEPVDRLTLNPPQLWPGSARIGAEISDHKFTFVGEQLTLGDTIQWYPKQASPLWQYHLHYFEWLADLKAAADIGTARRLITSWLEHCDRYHPTSWHPYPLSLRIISWITHADWLTTGAEDDFKTAFFDSLTRQVDHLHHNLEWDVGGNHLIKNLKALMYAGLCLPGKQSLYLDGFELLTDQLKVQIHEDGAHFERSPHYHVDVLRDMLDIHALLLKVGQPPSPFLDDVIERMGQALAFYRYPDGQLGLFNDSALGSKKHIDALLTRCGIVDSPANELPDVGYIRMQRGDLFMMIGAGKVCPDNLPAHGHADTLSFEMMVGGERLFVNSGTYGYQHKQRNILRGTPAHNTLCLEGENSAEVWDTFRIGRRPTRVGYTLSHDSDIGLGFEGHHNGYRHLGASVGRKLFMANNGQEIRGEETVHGKNGSRIAVHFHLAPGISYRLISDKEAEITTQKGRTLRFKMTGGRLHDALSNYAPQFGVLKASKQLVIRSQVRHNSAIIKWAITLND